MRIAIIGSGIAGLASAWLLSREHEVELFEANDYLGGHTHTHVVAWQGREYPVDSGFIVFNPANYPLLCRWFTQLGVATQATTMSFALRNEASGLEYNAETLATLFCRPANLWSPRFLGMLRDIRRFYREAPALLDAPGPGPTLGDYLADHGYGVGFRDDHLVPMAAALWSSPTQGILRFPAQYLVRFMANHCMLQVRDRPQWRVVRGGSQSYVRAASAGWRANARLKCPARCIRRAPDRVWVDSAAGSESFDQIVLACHADQALALLSDASDRERDVLGAMRYQENVTVLHTDQRLLPIRKRAWAAWNVLLPRAAGSGAVITYNMTKLQSLAAPVAFCVTLNGTEQIAPQKILKSLRYQHPLYDHASVAAQARRNEINGVNRSWYCGAYWGYGFHEDGIRSAVDVAAGLGVRWS